MLHLIMHIGMQSTMYAERAPGVRTVNLLYQQLRTSYEDEEANEVVDEGRSLLILSLVVYGFLVESIQHK